MAVSRTSGQGRPKGSPNRQTVEIADKLAKLGCDPLTGMAKIAMNAKNPMDLRARMYAELAQYIAPKRKAIEHSGEGGGPVMGLVMMPPKDPAGG